MNHLDEVPGLVDGRKPLLVRVHIIFLEIILLRFGLVAVAARVAHEPRYALGATTVEAPIVPPIFHLSKVRDALSAIGSEGTAPIGGILLANVAFQDIFLRFFRRCTYITGWFLATLWGQQQQKKNKKKERSQLLQCRQQQAVTGSRQTIFLWVG